MEKDLPVFKIASIHLENYIKKNKKKKKTDYSDKKQHKRHKDQQKNDS